MARQVLIVGLGLMGGSLGLALSAARSGRAGPRVCGLDRDPHVARTALERGVIDEVVSPGPAAARDCDLIVLATPVSALATEILALAGGCAPGTVITDLGSTKTSVVRGLEGRLPPGLTFVGGHPMAGREVQGLDGARPDLYRGAVWALSPPSLEKTDQGRTVEDLVRSVGARPVWLEPEDHDRCVARVSHMPYLAAVAVMSAALDPEGPGPRALELAAGGLADTTRVAGCPPALFADILLDNRDHVLAALAALAAQVTLLRDALVAGDRLALEASLAQAWRHRHSLNRSRRPGPDEGPDRD